MIDKIQIPDAETEILLENLTDELEKHRIKITDKIPPPEIAIKMYIDENPDQYAIMGTLGNFSVLTGKAKSKKTFAIGILTASLFSEKAIFDTFKGCLPPQQRKVIYFDTEQGKWHVQKSLKRICKLANITDDDMFSVYGLRSEPTDRRLALIENKIYNTENLGFVVIDGVRDITFDINDPKEASDIAGRFLRWTEERNIHIITILHQNKGDSNARGHLGTELVNKAETVLSVEKMSNSDISVVTATQSRNREPEAFAFAVDDDGLPYRTRPPQNENSKERFDITNIEPEKLEALFVHIFSLVGFSSLGYSELVIQIKINADQFLNMKFGDNRAKEILTMGKNLNIFEQVENKKGAPYSLLENLKSQFITGTLSV